MGLPHEITKRLSEPNCVLCGKEKENKTNALCNNCSPYIYDEKKKPHQQIRLSKEWRINREKRLNNANNSCECCGIKPESGLAVHHEAHINYFKIWYDLVDKFLKVLDCRLNQLLLLLLFHNPYKTFFNPSFLFLQIL